MQRLLGQRDCLHVAGEASKCLVKVIHLGDNAETSQNHKDISRRVAELVVACKGKLEGDAESLGRHDGNGADSRADGEIDERILLAVVWGNSVDHEDSKRDDGDGIEEETWWQLLGTMRSFLAQRSGRHTRLHGVVKDLISSLNLLVRRRM